MIVQIAAAVVADVDDQAVGGAEAPENIGKNVAIGSRVHRRDIDIAEMAAGFGERLLALALDPALASQGHLPAQGHGHAFFGETPPVGMLDRHGDQFIGASAQHPANAAFDRNVFAVDLAQHVAGLQRGVGDVERTIRQDLGHFHARTGIALVVIEAERSGLLAARNRGAK